MTTTVTVRMYNVGFGDCFLLTFPAPDRPRRVLVDCGTHRSGPGPRPTAAVVERLIADCTSDGHARIDVVVGTHRHQDHVSGFANPLWREVEVGEVWLPWTEDPADPEATAIRERQSRLALGLTALGGRPAFAAAAEMAANLALSNEAAMTTLHHGFAGAPVRRFLAAGPAAPGGPEVAALLPGVTVHVLGPSRDPAIIREMNPPASEHYLRMAAGAGDDDGGPARSPFGDGWGVAPAEFAADARHRHLALAAEEVAALDAIGEDGGLAAAVALENAVNGTSLMLLFELGAAHLLFPGDAQWGTWQAAMREPRWRALLAKTTLLKVGHHGSHNATPVTFVEEVLADGGCALVSTRKMKRWTDIPRGRLLTRLEEKGIRWVRSDQPPAALPAGFTHGDDAVTEVGISV